MSNFFRVASTAYSVARSRALSDIPFAKEISEWMEKELGENKIVSDAFKPKRVVTIEARYKLLNKLILQHNKGQVLELASGLLPRGYLLSKKGITYVETDLANLVSLKKRMYKSIFLKTSSNLFLEKANALSKKELLFACRHFTSKPLIITHEGLLRYLTFNEKRIVASNIHFLLEKYGGKWITCDITLARFLPPFALKKIKDRIGMDVSRNAFRNVTHAKKFFTSLGFKVKVHRSKEILFELSTPAVLGLTAKETKLMLDFYVFEMTAG
jgi:O-methyltransferase involved in polyketide biosynthesis